MGKPIDVTDETFEEEVLKSDVPVLTDFWAEWCGPCKLISPVLEEIAEEYDGRVKLTKLDVDENPNVTMTYGIMSIPTVILFKDGQEVERVIGAMPKHRLLRRFAPYIETA
ncbi:MAG: thioredoxin [Anaerolineae bacterium]|nr:thioredoxin [Anaerolineae bacterium]